MSGYDHNELTSTAEIALTDEKICAIYDETAKLNTNCAKAEEIWKLH